MSTPDRQELVRNAVTFLSDPKTQSSPLAQRIQFLEAKGLTNAEIEDAMRRSVANSSAAGSYMQRYQTQYPPYGPAPYPAYPGPASQWDWRDYFITAVVSGTIAYGAVALFRKYVLPHLRPPSSTAYEQDREELQAAFDSAEAMLKEIQAETAAVRAGMEETKAEVTKTTEKVNSVIQDMEDAQTKSKDEMREIRDEIQNIREMLPKMIDRNKETQQQSLAELQQELKSLKALLLSRGPSFSSTPASPLPSLAGKPTIPAWQLAGPSASSSSTPVPSVPLVHGPSSESGVSGKGKEVSEPNGMPS
ncbi:hypothetical protein GLOTRDRAFT_113297 [Gloeophyllum trabeum ATCC 11539]|uniref:Peroxisomal membrane protein PEX14 n=1 Tax=Gloeophyllum trabeum (strain ATCC 11539 / FP-39264 / Madison 617) TaxID=670483 RepID=S7S077_GLOTA|nr:uncharacterized protein GLOTRDRAFT_113297 [Gloeophyllum trabeum ATCC 11539]EPQ60750.1 hypothetical protein GLOTRDRAFT_113297 [Gloeophyllum trabeum ATCC 11539]